ncbi:MAG: ATP synthase F1 subunit gamma [Candidatus Saccharimonadales bacterium]
MANTITLKRRISSVRNTRQITKAMELVSASKMRRAQERAATGRTYRQYAYSLLTRLSAITEVEEHPLFVKRPIKTRLYILITSNSGLAGAYNANVIRMFMHAIIADEKAGIKCQTIAIGKKGAQFVRNIHSVDLIAAYTDVGDHPDANAIRPILHSATDLYRAQKIDDVQLLYTQYKSNLVQIATELSLLPARFVETQEAVGLSNTTFEPTIQAVLDNVTERLLEVQVYQAYLDSKASEESMRMMAMKNATDNASDLIADYTLEYNTARQAAITQELAEITGGAEAIQS